MKDHCGRSKPRIHRARDVGKISLGIYISREMSILLYTNYKSSNWSFGLHGPDEFSFGSSILILYAFSVVGYHYPSVTRQYGTCYGLRGSPWGRISVVSKKWILISQIDPPGRVPLRKIHLHKKMKFQIDRNRSYVMHHTHTYQGKQTVHQSKPWAWFARPKRGHRGFRGFVRFYSSKLIVLRYQVKSKFGRKITENDPRGF